jgi:23S rRNA-/tRNA-specific pseudouridylate synthase
MLQKVHTFSRKVDECRALPDGKPAQTEYQVLSMCAGDPTKGGVKGVCGAALVLARPLSGRTHQVRLHLAHAGLPIVGDSLYGVAVEDVRSSVEAFESAGLMTKEEQEAAARRGPLGGSSTASASSEEAAATAAAAAVDSNASEGRMALHAWNLKTVHPRTGGPLRQGLTETPPKYHLHNPKAPPAHLLNTP